MDKKGKLNEMLLGIKNFFKTFKQSYLYKMVSKFLSVICSIVLVILLIVGGLMFYFNMKIKSYNQKGLDYTSPFGLYTIISGSMEPNVSIYDVVIAVEQDMDKIKVGDVITFISNWDINYGKTITHRVIGIDKTATGEIQLTTKGDNNPTPDGGNVTKSNLVGKVVGRLPQLGRLQFFLATKMGWFLVVFIPAMIIIIVDTMKIFKLYVLKTKIDKVKSTGDIEKEVGEKQKIEKRETVAIEEEPPKVESEIPEDENVDTVELPKVGEDGIIKENPSELPVLVNHNVEHTDDVDILTASLDIIKEDEENREEDSDLPMLKKNVEEETTVSEPERKILKRRD